ncbi:hypothetical protein CYY_001948 [Polysphondylium violaceum]|uniref:Acid ceramidase-like protein n=1 Tax=Polysphondylium violaceum TaxID=133409 RepID=A0A8J4Q0X3_9MYCE|nr:hypothetical protein CYY_001948 [Polysphondylium violaceum]
MTKSINLSLLLCLVITAIAYAQDNCKGKANTFDIYTDEPVLVNQTNGGWLYKTGGANNTVHVLHVYGNPYQMGYAHGALLRDQIQQMMPMFMSYAVAAVTQTAKATPSFFPQYILNIIQTEGVLAALDSIHYTTAPYTNIEFYEEIQGLSEGADFDYQTLVRMHMFPELIKASCSIVGAWGQASVGGNLFQLRALDWGIDNPLVNFPTFIVYHPEEDNGNPFSVLSWTGFIGALTGYSQRTGVSEKVWSGYSGSFSYTGTPFYFLMRDIIQYDSSIQEALTRINNAQRTCAIFLGVGSNSTNTLNVVEYSHDTAAVFNDQTPFPGFAPTPAAHPTLTDLVYVDKHVQPSNDPCMAALLQYSYGKIDAQALINIVSLFQTGDLHIGIYDFVGNQVYVSVANTNVPYPNPLNQPMSPSYQNQFIQFDMNKLFALAPPKNI